MRTTINIDEQVLAQAKQIAAQTHRTIGSVVEDALRQFLVEQSAAATVEPVRLPRFTYARPGLRDGVDLYDKDQIEELLSAAGHAFS